MSDHDPIAVRPKPPPRITRGQIGLVAGLVLAVGVQLVPTPEGLSREGWVVASVTLLMASWWVSEAIPIPVTAMLPMVLFPLAGVASFREAAAPYAHPVVMLLLGGFIIAKGVERWNLHARIALMIVARAGARPEGLVLGFMIAAALLSMWISNTATTLMMAPIALSVARIVLGETRLDAPFAYALLLGLAYAASIGGLGTPVGTPTNLIAIGQLEETGGVAISFTQWTALGAPMALVLVPAAWWVLTRWAFRLEHGPAEAAQAHVRAELAALGPVTTPEARTLAVFAVIAFLWVFGAPLKGLEIAGMRPFAGLTDHLTAILGAVLMFLVPAGDRSRGAKKPALLDWETARQIPWGVYILFGGGMSLAAAISDAGVSAWLGEQLAWIAAYPTIVVLLALVTLMIFATEVTSNIATAAALTPVVIEIATAGAIEPALLAAPVAMAASCAFMLPMATGPNAIVYATGRAPMAVMMRAGLRLNLAAIALITALSLVLAPLALG